MRLRLFVTLSLSFLFAGCPGGGFSIADAALTDGARLDSSGLDGGPQPDTDTPRRDAEPDAPLNDACNPAPTCEAGCPRPWLLAAVEDLQTVECGGRVLRFSLSASGACRCDGYSLPRDIIQPRALTYIPGDDGADGTIVVAATDGVIGLGANRFLMRETAASVLPLDAFTIEDEEGQLLAGVVKSFGGSGRTLFFYTPEGMRSRPPSAQGALGSGTQFYTQSPAVRRRYRRTGPNSTSRDVDPWLNRSFLDSPFDSSSPSKNSIYSYYYDGLFRSVIATDDAIVAVTGVDEESRSALPIQCGGAFADCAFTSAVSDPMDADGVYAVCYIAPMLDTAIIHMKLSSGTCTEVLAPGTGAHRIPRIALALDSYWQ